MMTSSGELSETYSSVTIPIVADDAPLYTDRIMDGKTDDTRDIRKQRSKHVEDNDLNRVSTYALGKQLFGRMPTEMLALSLLLAAFMLFRKRENFLSTSADSAKNRQLEKSIHRSFHSGRTSSVLEVWKEVRSKNCWVSRVALEIVVRSMIAEDEVNEAHINQYICKQYPKEKEQVRIATSLIEMCASRGNKAYLDAMVALMNERGGKHGVELSRLSSYLAVTGALAAAGRAEDVDRALDSIQTYEGGIPHRAFVVAIMGLLNAGTVWQGLRMMRRMEECNLGVPTQCLVSFFKTGAEQGKAGPLLDQAMTLNSKLSAEVLTVLANAAYDADDFDLGRKVVRLCRGQGGCIDASIWLLRLLKNDETSSLVEIFSLTTQTAAIAPTQYKAFFQVCIDVGSEPLCSAVFSRCLEDGLLERPSGEMDEDLVRTALAACAALGMTKEQERLKSGLDASGRSGLERAGRPARSPGALRSAEQFRKAVQQRMTVQEFMYHIRLSAEHDDVAYAAEVLLGMLAQHGPHVCAEGRPGGSALQCGVKAVVKSGNVDDVVTLAQSFSQISTTFWTFVLGELRAGASAATSRACMAEMRRLCVKPTGAMYAHMVAIELMDGNFGPAAALLATLRAEQLWSSELVLILGRALQGLFQEKITESLSNTGAKERLLVECIALAKVLENLLTEDFSRALINACMSLGMLGSIGSVLETLPRQGVPMYTAVMKAYASLGKVDETLVVWDEMTMEKHIIPSQVCLGQALNVLASNNRPNQARALMLEWRSQVEPNCVMYTTVIKGLARAKDFDTALEVWEQMKADGIEPNTKAFNTLLDACARAGRMDTDGSKILAEMARLQIPVASVTVSTAVKGFCAKGLLNEAAASLGGDATQQIQSRGAHSPDDASAFNALLDGCVKAGDFGRFDSTYEEMVVKGVRPTSFTLTALVKRYGNAGQLDQAFHCVETLCQKFGRRLLNVHVATCLISASFRNRAAHRAIQFFETLKATGVTPDAITYGTVISGTKTMGAEGNSIALRFVLEALVPPGPGLTDGAVMDFVGRLEAAGTLPTVGRALLKDLTAARAPIPKPLSLALSRSVTSSSTSEQTLGRRSSSWSKAK